MAFAYRLKDEIRTGLGFTVNIGISTNFFIGKDGKRFQKVDIIFNFVEEIHSSTAPPRQNGKR